MEDGSYATLGVALGGIAFAAAALPWEATGVGPVENVALAVLGAAAFGAFAFRRHGLLGRGPGALLAGTASLAVVGYAAVATAGVLGGRAPPWGVGLAFVGGVGGVIAAYGDGRGIPSRAVAVARALGRSLALGFAGLLAIAVWTNVAAVVARSLFPGELNQLHILALGAIALGFGTGTVAALYFHFTDRTLSFLDFKLPSLRGLGYFVGGTVVLFVVLSVLSVVFAELGVSTSSHSIEQSAREGDPTILLWLIPASWLIIGPGEELLYRNVIQKSLYDNFSKPAALVMASVVFSLVHIPAYATGASLLSLVNTLLVIFVLSLVLGAVYLRTENTTIPALVHGTFNAIIFAALYVQLTGAPSV